MADGGEPVIGRPELFAVVTKVVALAGSSLVASWHWLIQADITGAVKDWAAAGLTMVLGIIAILAAIDKFKRSRELDRAEARRKQIQIAHENRMLEIQAQIDEQRLLASHSQHDVQKKLDAALASLHRSEVNQQKMRDGLHDLRDKLSNPELDRKSMSLILDRMEADLGVMNKLVVAAERIEKAAESVHPKSGDGL